MGSKRPATTYRTVSPETWSLIRGAYLSGLSAPTVGARFGVSEGAIRKRARREGWTKRLYAAQATPWRGPASVWSGSGSGAWSGAGSGSGTGAPGEASPSAPSGPAPSAPSAPSAASGPDALTEDQVMAAWTSPLQIRPADLARRALANAAHAVKSGQGLNALRLARAATEIARLDGLLDWADVDVAEADAVFEAHQTMMRLFLREKALELARTLAAGGDLPPEYSEIAAASAEAQA